MENQDKKTANTTAGNLKLKKDSNTIGADQKTAELSETKIPVDLIDDLKKGKIDPLTEGKTNLGYDEKTVRKEELKQKEHYDQQEES
ncbi:hypothetical protein [Flavobacterium sp. 7A]|uniref:hypothetical protein n=1 Tax=Flavobacterium sp. 7A TaxID=2940571 RepID=UPI0022276BA9|nr:hypothetical protein [Flavobacterium sp. 7A]MCW2120227.1 hypothetical protein [Flavobacterium sp. 7A]